MAYRNRGVTAQQILRHRSAYITPADHHGGLSRRVVVPLMQEQVKPTDRGRHKARSCLHSVNVLPRDHHICYLGSCFLWCRIAHQDRALYDDPVVVRFHAVVDQEAQQVMKSVESFDLGLDAKLVKVPELIADIPGAGFVLPGGDNADGRWILNGEVVDLCGHLGLDLLEKGFATINHGQSSFNTLVRGV